MGFFSYEKFFFLNILPKSCRQKTYIIAYQPSYSSPAIVQPHIFLAKFKFPQKPFPFSCKINSSPDDDVIVVDADDLLRKPNEMMNSYCNVTGLPYRAGMTSWKPGPVADWSVWGSGWMDEVERTDGFRRHDPKAPKATKFHGDLPAHIQDLIKEAIPNYLEMFEARLKV